jgi:putative transposon-encoded protein
MSEQKFEEDRLFRSYVEKIKRVAESFRFIFEDSTDIVNRVVKGSDKATSGLVYVPKKHIGKVVTVVVWEKDIKKSTDEE